MSGPADFTMNDESGIVIEGHDLPPMVRQPWHPPYYQRLLESADVALEKEVDLFMWELDISDREQMLEILPELAPRRPREARRDDPPDDAPAAARGHGRLRRDLQPRLAAQLRASSPTTRPTSTSTRWRCSWCSTRRGSWSPRSATSRSRSRITFPDINQVLRKMNGRILPFGWWHYLRRNKIIDKVRVGFLGVKPKFQHTGAAAALYVEHFDTSAVPPADQERRDGLDPGDQPGDEPRHGGHARARSSRSTACTGAICSATDRRLFRAIRLREAIRLT